MSRMCTIKKPTVSSKIPSNIMKMIILFVPTIHISQFPQPATPITSAGFALSMH